MSRNLWHPCICQFFNHVQCWTLPHSFSGVFGTKLGVLLSQKAAIPVAPLHAFPHFAQKAGTLALSPSQLPSQLVDEQLSITEFVPCICDSQTAWGSFCGSIAGLAFVLWFSVSTVGRRSDASKISLRRLFASRSLSSASILALSAASCCLSLFSRISSSQLAKQLLLGLLHSLVLHGGGWPEQPSLSPSIFQIHSSAGVLGFCEFLHLCLQVR